MTQPQVVAELVRESDAAAAEQTDAEGADLRYPAGVVAAADDQVHEVGAGPVAQGMELVQVAVGRILEPGEVHEGAGLAVRHLGPGHENQPLADAARRVGLVRLRD